MAHQYNGILLGNVKIQTLGPHNMDRTQEVTHCITLFIYRSHNDSISETEKRLEVRGVGKRDGGVTVKGSIWSIVMGQFRVWTVAVVHSAHDEMTQNYTQTSHQCKIPSFDIAF